MPVNADHRSARETSFDLTLPGAIETHATARVERWSFFLYFSRFTIAVAFGLLPGFVAPFAAASSVGSSVFP